ncbi:hypothetical protein [Armatimonas sp.]|uniref:hypothetical protein n=1 Tax=Armatimonas sp. TaxID=1872638 RepID=UPI003753981B
MEEQPQAIEEKTAIVEKKRKNSEQDQRIQNDITETAVMLQNIESDSELKSALNGAGIDDDELDLGKAKQTASQDGYNTRQDSIGAEESANNTLKVVWPIIEAEAIDIREVLRARFSDSGNRRALGIVGNLPQDRQKTITVMRATYSECKKPEYQTILSKSGYGISAIDEYLGNLTTAENAISAARKAVADGKRATTLRNAAIKDLRQWVSMVKRIAKRALRTRPDLLDKLGI